MPKRAHPNVAPPKAGAAVAAFACVVLTGCAAAPSDPDSVALQCRPTADVAITACTPAAAGTFAAHGTVNNPTNDSWFYNITIGLLDRNGALLDTETATVQGRAVHGHKHSTFTATSQGPQPDARSCRIENVLRVSP